MGMSVGVLDHFNIRTRKLADTVRFYEDVLGLEKGDRPNFAFPGAWMYSEGKAVVHLVDISPTEEAQKPDSGVVHHVAFVSRGFDAMKSRLKSKNMPFDARQVPGGDLWQIFVNDPNGVMIELNYEAAKEQGTSAPSMRADDVGRT
ncbi:VOC family protein [Bradyrhizobium sp.]|uniref:VOC family protein n=1 Tax=Bradyrhizobium sp. TaxID=376 RepID=UPI0023A4F93C|nr:VOC family protein [Bradyrhizobium sp.]MDE1936789.1 VOC family protein [Bradyrhizobium sp.]MDE2063247.1 VOC family protein [Bradyrhizobium sp.]